MRKKHRRTIPSLRLRMFSVAPVPAKTRSRAITERTRQARIIRGISRRTVLLVIVIGVTRALIPPMTSTLKMLLPTTFPIDISELPLRADSRLTMSSGEEVPKATIVSPTTRGDTPKRRASAEAPSVR